MSDTAKVLREPLFQIEKRANLPAWKAWAIRGGALLAGLVISCIISALFLGENPLIFFGNIFTGALGTERRIKDLLQAFSLLLGVSLALLPAFKMKFWNLGANGQVLMGALAAVACMWHLGGSIPSVLLHILMIVCAVVVGAIWAVIPAIFKALWGTNESLFTLMMNYIAEGLVAFMLSVWIKDGSGIMRAMYDDMIPKIGGHTFLIPFLVTVLLTAIMYVYMKYTKHGYEISVVGESENTARYVGINVKKVVIRTLIVSGAICGLVGFLYAGVIDGMISKSTHDGYGFTAILVAWLGQLNPLAMAVMAFSVGFVENGVSFAARQAGVTNTAFPNIVTGIIFFFVIACEFIIMYKVKLRAGKKGGAE